MKVLAIYHLKGGVGKTAAAVNLAYLAAQSGAPTLVCDLDSQAAATFYFRVRPKLKAKHRLFLRRGKALWDDIKATDFDRLDLLPGALSHRRLTETFARARRPANCLRDSLARLRRDYRYVVLDCPPEVGLLAENVFRAADRILLPIVPTPLSVHAYRQVRKLYVKHGHDRDKLRTFFSMVEYRKKLHRSVMAELSASPEVLPHVVPYLVEVENMGVHREPVVATRPTSRAALAYLALWQEMRELLG